MPPGSRASPARRDPTVYEECNDEDVFGDRSMMAHQRERGPLDVEFDDMMEEADRQARQQTPPREAEAAV